MNIDFSVDPGFSTYVVLLMFSGLAMILMASPMVKHSTAGVRALNALFGLGFLGYGFYLAFLFQGGGYLIFFKAFILPVLMIFRTIRSARASRSDDIPAQGSPAFGQQSPAVPYPSAHPPAYPSAYPSESAPPAAHWGPPVADGERPARS